jgi:hypothetical protein
LLVAIVSLVCRAVSSRTAVRSSTSANVST